MHKVKWLGHSCCQITSQEGKVILIDPWITGNPTCPVKKEDIGQVDVILVTHDHFDHIGTDIPAIVAATGATVVVQPELIEGLQAAGVEGGNIVSYGMGMNIGGTVEVKGIKITMTEAHHSSAAGTPCGYIVTLEDGKTIYHAGDTSIFAGMQLLGEIYNIELALVPIGSVFVMDPVQAAYSLKLINAKVAIPIHYATFPILTQDASGFVQLAEEKAPGTKVAALKPGEEVSI